MGQQISAAAAAEGISSGASLAHSNALENQSRTTGNGEGSGIPYPLHNAAFRNHTGASQIPSVRPEPASTSAQNDPHKMSSKTEVEVNRMSIRAAIDSFIENCLSASNDFSPGDEKNQDSLGSNSQCSSGVDGGVGERKGSRDSQVSGKVDIYECSGSKAVNSNKNEKSAKTVSIKEDDNEDCELIIDCDESSPTEKREEKKLDDSSLIVDGKNPKSEKGKEETGGEDKRERSKTGEGKQEKKKESSLENLSGSYTSDSDKPKKLSPSTEKQSFSEYLQDRLKQDSFDKQEELNQLASSKDIQSHGQMLMWEMTKKPVATAETASSASSGQGGIPYTGGPVRLQALIDKVLDNSLNNQDMRPAVSLNSKKKEEGYGNVVPQEKEKRSMESSQKDSSPKDIQPRDGKDSNPRDADLKDKHRRMSDEDKSDSASKPKWNSLCFKDHIEKVLIESFLSYEKEAEEDIQGKGELMKDVKAFDVKTDVERSKTRKENTKLAADGTISVQDIVDSVISQTEVISKLLTPTSSEASKTTSTQGGENSVPPSTTVPSPSHPSLKYQHMTPHGQALLEAQRHAVQKEHQSSATMGRKRGRPRLGSPMNNMANWGVDGNKDGKGNVQGHRDRDMRSHPIPPGSHPVDLNSRSGGPSLHGHPHPRSHQGPPALDYTSHGSLQYGMPVGISALMASQGKSPPSAAMFQQRHHHNQSRQPQQGPVPSSKSSPAMPISSGSVYHPHPHAQDSFHHRGGQHVTSPNQPSQHRPGIHPGHPTSSKPPPPLILADHVNETMSGSSSGSRLVPVSHIPTKSCSCQSCIAHFSRDKSPSHGLPPPSQHHHHMRHPPPKQERAGNPSPNSHPSHYLPYQTTSPRRSSKDFYPHQVPPTSSESLRPVVAVPSQGIPTHAIIPSYIAQRQRQDSQAATQQLSRDATASRYYDPKRRNPSPGHYPPPHSGHHPHAGLAKPTSVDPRYPDSDRHNMPRLTAAADHPVYDPDPSRRVAREKTQQPTPVEQSKAVLIPHIPPASPANQDADQPLDLSVKPSPAHRKEARPSQGEQGPDLSRQSTNFSDGRPTYRHPATEMPSRGQAGLGQYGEYEQRGSSGHHLQRLENSVDRFLPHGQTQPVPQGQQFSPHSHLSQQQQQPPKMSSNTSSHPAHSEIRGGQVPLPDRHGVPPGASHPSPHFHQESSNYRGSTSLHPSQSPSSYHHPLSRTSPSQQQQPQPQPQHNRPVGPSPTSGQYQSSRSPLVGPNPHHHRSVNASPHHQQYNNGSQSKPVDSSAYQRPPSHGSDLEAQASLGMAAPPVPPQSTPSPDEQEAQRLGVSKHEPIQNIIGNHPPSDILYLICRMCRQTYGSPYGFRKHFRNQHGFEPKAEHTIVQTISATKTAMAHTVPLEHADKTTFAQQFKEERIIYEDQHEKPHIRDGNITPTNHSSSNSGDDNKLDIRKDLSEDTKFLECPECGQTFQLNDFGSYKRHCRQHSLHRNSGPFACHDCQKSYAEPGQLKEHLDTHNTFTPSVCGICRTFFSSPNYLAEHLQAAHGHGHNTDGNEKSFAGSDSMDGVKKNEDYLIKSEDLSVHGKGEIEAGEIKRSSSFSASSSAHAAKSHLSSPDQHQTSRSSSVSYKPTHNTPPLPLSKRHRVNMSSADSQLFTVHTPKGLEIQKLPADAVVTTASPDSSYDEAKFHLDSQPGSSTSRRNVTTADATTSGDTDTTKETKGDTDTSHSYSDNKNGNTIINLPKQLHNDVNKSQNKDETESSSSDRCASVESNNTMEGSRASTPSVDDADKFYKHKKYSRHRKRVSSCDVGSEPDSKCAKPDGSGNRQDQSPYSVTSTANSGITVRDCESSCLHSEDSNSCSFKSKGDDEKKKDDKDSGEKCDQMSDSRNKKLEPGNEDTKSGKKTGSGESGNKFKWDRQTRSQSGKSAHSVSYLSS